MATHSSVLAWRTPGMAEPGGLLSMVSHIVWHDWRDLAAVAVAVFTHHTHVQTWPNINACLWMYMYMHVHTNIDTIQTTHYSSEKSWESNESNFGNKTWGSISFVFRPNLFFLQTNFPPLPKWQVYVNLATALFPPAFLLQAIQYIRRLPAFSVSSPSLLVPNVLPRKGS